MVNFIDELRKITEQSTERKQSRDDLMQSDWERQAYIVATKDFNERATHTAKCGLNFVTVLNFHYGIGSPCRKYPKKLINDLKKYFKELGFKVNVKHEVTTRKWLEGYDSGNVLMEVRW